MLFYEILCVILTFPLPFNEWIQQKLSPQFKGRQFSHLRSSLWTPLLLRQAQRFFNKQGHLAHASGGLDNRLQHTQSHAGHCAWSQRLRRGKGSVFASKWALQVREATILSALCCIYGTTTARPYRNSGRSRCSKGYAPGKNPASQRALIWLSILLINMYFIVSQFLILSIWKKEQKFSFVCFLFVFKKWDRSFVWFFLWDRNNFNMGYVPTLGSFPVIWQEKLKPAIRSSGVTEYR